MTLIDSYIKKHRLKQVPVLAQEIGVSATFVQARLDAMELVRSKEYLLMPNNEMIALINLIEVRKTGWAVDVARVRLKELNDARNSNDFTYRRALKI